MTRSWRRCPDLRVVANVAVGFNNIDVEAATRRRVVITNTPDVLTETTADFAWALLMATARRVVEGDQYVRQGRFTQWEYMRLLGGDVHGKTLGIIGFGRIGRAMARRALGFGMRVLYQDAVRRRCRDRARPQRHARRPGHPPPGIRFRLGPHTPRCRRPGISSAPTRSRP